MGSYRKFHRFIPIVLYINFCLDWLGKGYTGSPVTNACLSFPGCWRPWWVGWTWSNLWSGLLANRASWAVPRWSDFSCSFNCGWLQNWHWTYWSILRTYCSFAWSPSRLVRDPIWRLVSWPMRRCNYQRCGPFSIDRHRARFVCWLFIVWGTLSHRPSPKWRYRDWWSLLSLWNWWPEPVARLSWHWHHPFQRFRWISSISWFRSASWWCLCSIAGSCCWLITPVLSFIIRCVVATRWPQLVKNTGFLLFCVKFGSFTGWRADRCRIRTWTILLLTRTQTCNACLVLFRSWLCIFTAQPVFRNFRAWREWSKGCLGCSWTALHNFSSFRRRPNELFLLCSRQLFP